MSHEPTTGGAFLEEWERDKDPHSRRSLVPMLVWSVATTTVGLLLVAVLI